MFFPTTHGDKISLDPDRARGSAHRTASFSVSVSDKKYLHRSTIIMCNPNALIYQWMVTSANAYWLDFFLRRDCNVLIWNYRGYGESEQSIWRPNLTPEQQKVDAERVLQFLVNRIQVKGKIGVYGRSIGGIAAAHLVSKFPSIVKCFVGDRTMGLFDNVVLNRFTKSQCLLALYRLLSRFWHIDNSKPLLQNKSCYKILTFDEQDEVIDIGSSMHHGVAKYHSS
jgi:pimeloyl-ACP methyl ester carboxylesterase